MRKLGETLARALPHRSSLATASSAAVPPCMLVGGAPVILRPIQGYPWVRLAAGSTLVLTPWPETSPSARASRPKIGRGAAWLNRGVTAPGSHLSVPLRVWIWVSLVFFVGFLQ